MVFETNTLDWGMAETLLMVVYWKKDLMFVFLDKM